MGSIAAIGGGAQNSLKMDTNPGLSAEDRQKIRESAQEFEALFVGIMLKSMREATPKSDFVNGGHAEDVFRSMLDDEYAKLMAKTGYNGIASLLEHQLLDLGTQSRKLIDQNVGQKVYQTMKFGQ